MSEETAESITAASGSNLALAFIALPKERRRDMNVFYAFCRRVDDIADDPACSMEEKRRDLDAWKTALSGEKRAANTTLQNAVLELLDRYPISRGYLLEIIAGVMMDLDKNRYRSFEELKTYCHRVASVVGLVSIEIFGYKHSTCRQYAENLGLALQITNILRDVSVDVRNGDRIYLPMEDLERFGVTENQLREGRMDEKFLALMEFEATRAQYYYREALANLAKEDKRSMVAAEIMRHVYFRLLERMQMDRFRVFEKNYKLSKMEKLWLILRTMWLG